MTSEELKNQIPSEILPDYLGGTFKLNHKNWLIECNKLITNKSSTAYTYYHDSKSSDLESKPVSEAQDTQLSSNSSSSISNNDDNHTDIVDEDTSMKPNESLIGGVNRKRNLSEPVIDIDNKKQTIQTNNNFLPESQQISNSVDERFLLKNFDQTNEFLEDLNDKIEPLPFDDL